MALAFLLVCVVYISTAPLKQSKPCQSVSITVVGAKNALAESGQ